ncbi:MAG: hypothetical protein AAGD38_23145 [Acidobacteriota bacterium]
MQRLFLVILLGLLLTLPASATFPQVRVLVEGATFQGTNGITVGPDDHLYVASVSGRQIGVVDPRTGRVLERFGNEVGVETPDDLTFGSDGSLYWTSIYTGQVGRLFPDGTSQIIANLPPGANPIAFNSDGRLFVALSAFGDALYELDPDGVDTPELLIDQPGSLNGFEFGPDGLLYSPSLSTGSVVRIDVDARTLETVATGFGLITAVAFDSLDQLYATAPTGEIFRVDIVTGTFEVAADLAEGGDNLAFDDRDRLYVTSLLDGSIRRVNLDTGRIRTVVSGGMTTPGGIAVTPRGFFGLRDEVWVADFFSLRSFTGFTGRELEFVPTIPLLTPLVGPSTIAVDGDHFVLSSWILNAVQVYDPATESVLTSVGDFATPLNAIGWDGDLVVSELGTGSVVRADGDDPTQRTILGSGLAVPTGLALDHGDLYVAEWAAGTIRQLTQAGQILDPAPVIVSGLAQPEGLIVLDDGDLAVVETGAGRVTRIDPVTGATSLIADDLELGAIAPVGAPPTWLFSGIAQGQYGRLFVSGDIANVIYSIRLVHH